MKVGEVWKPKENKTSILSKYLDEEMMKTVFAMRVVILGVANEKVTYAYFRKGHGKLPKNKNFSTRENFLAKFERDYNYESK